MNTHNRHGLTVGQTLLLGLAALGLAVIWLAKAIWFG